MNRACLITLACLSIASQVFAMQGAVSPAAPTAKGTPALRVPDALLAPPAATDLPAEAPARTSDGVTTPTPFDPAAYRRTVNAANAAMRAQDWKAAADGLQQALAMRPDSKEVAYNLGVAKFQQGDFAGARKLFQESGQNASADLAARSMYNQGNAIYADAMKNLPKVPDNGKAPAGAPQSPQIPPEELQKALQQVEQAFTHFKDASAANPGDEDSAANAETSLKLMKELKKRQEQQSKDQQQKQDQKKEQQQKRDQQKQSQDQQEQDPKQQEDKQQDQQKQDQQQQRSQGQDQPSSSKQDSRQQDRKDSQQKDQQGQSGQDPQQKKQEQPKPNQPDQQKPDQAQQNKPEPKKATPQDQPQDQKDQSPQQSPQRAQQTEAGQGAEAKQGKLDRNQADQLLQMVRDKEKERNAERKAQQAKIRPTPVDRDW